MPGEKRIPTCFYCSVSMEMGMFIDGSQGQYVQGVWVAGIPVTQRFLGMDVGTLTLKGRAQHPVTVYRCPECGFLQAFALPKDAAHEEAAQTLLRASQPDKDPQTDLLLRPSDKEQSDE
ncbi:MAG: hypothetical protein JWN14_2165 [Chthonomonadales bacterium]|nr:hypothetical protein [Chthonomonadales bacterium]